MLTRERAAKLAETLGDPDPPEYQTGPPEPTLEDPARQARAQAVFDVLSEFGEPPTEE